MHEKQALILNALKYQNLSSSAIANATGISQPTVSRALKKLPVMKIGAGRSSQFACIESEESFYQVDRTGSISQIGLLYRQPQNRTLLMQDDKPFSYEGLPFYLYDAIPSGFLGSIHLKHISERDQRLSSKSQDWSDLQILHYLTQYGDDLAGNLILGSKMAQKASNINYPVISRKSYPKISADIHHSPQNMGSSIAGEQPKFTAYNGKQHLIIKYSPLLSENNPVATRHRDLMICEHLALEALNKAGIEASKSQLHFDDRIYLEIERFDRMGEQGRQGMVSLKYLDAEYTGLNGNWVAIAKALLNQNLITTEALFNIEMAYAFGKYIANSDMHNGNCAFFINNLDLLNPTPVYDMLPMAYMPSQGELKNPDLKSPRFIDTSQEAMQRAKEIAFQFWTAVMAHPIISADFKKTIQPFVSGLES